MIMRFEVEIKFRVADHAALAERLAALGAVAGPSISQEDTYLAHPDRDFARTNEALRLRRQDRDNRITYKGPKREGPTKTREEIEVAIAEGPEALGRMTRLFEILGFRPLATIRKTRTPYHFHHQGREMEIALDLAEGLGAFAEVEAIADGEADLAAAQEAVQALARDLSLAEVEPRSYLRMHLERAGASSPTGAFPVKPPGPT